MVTASIPPIAELWPNPAPLVEPMEANAAMARPAPDGRPWVAMVMIASIDGAAVIDGRSGGLGRPADTAVFRSMRAVADAIVVGAETARAEDYGLVPVRNAAQRAAKGQSPAPRLAVLSNSLHFRADGRLFGTAATRPGPHERPLIYTSSDAVSPVSEDAAELVRMEATTPAAVLADLRDRGNTVVVLEGGPSLNAQFLAADLVDEINVTLAPLTVAGKAPRLAQGAAVDVPREFELTRVWTGDGLLFTQHVRTR